ncbi:LytTR family DNA-binding domain-containing protein [Diplocloster hominis]|uniref:LytR/AlgR family response regulator transcription factor n=1 Tax=Diplocloster hominis TaxID=3079010 RepID=UPI0031BAEC2E
MIIAVCDDNETERNNLADCLRHLLRERRLDAVVCAFESGGEMLAAMNGKAFPINFLDIYMEGMGGVELAQRIAECDPKAAIVFTTSSADHMAESYAVGAVHYLVKPYTENDAAVALDRCLRLTGRPEPYIVLNIERESKKVLLSQIRMVEFQNRCCLIRTNQGEIRVYMRLDELQSRLADRRFLRCHRSYLVNLDYVTGTKGSDFLMNDGSLVPIKREDKASAKAAFEDYYFEKLRQTLKERM